MEESKPCSHNDHNLEKECIETIDITSNLGEQIDKHQNKITIYIILFCIFVALIGFAIGWMCHTGYDLTANTLSIQERVTDLCNDFIKKNCECGLNQQKINYSMLGG